MSTLGIMRINGRSRAPSGGFTNGWNRECLSARNREEGPVDLEAQEGSVMTRLEVPAILLLAIMAGGCSPRQQAGSNEVAAANRADASVSPANISASAPRDAGTDQVAPTILLRGHGLLLETPGHGVPLVFDKTTAAEVEEALASLGPPKRASNDECPAGKLDFLDWSNGLQTTFQDGKFVGWFVDKSGSTLSTADGLSVGATRADVVSGGTKAEIFESTLGTEFTIGDLGGMLDGTGSGARVTDLWAGTNCFFR